MLIWTIYLYQFVLFKDAYALFKFSDHYHMSIAMAHTGLLGGEIPSGQRWFHGQGNAPPGTMPQWKMGTSLNLNRACPPFLYLDSVFQKQNSILEGFGMGIWKAKSLLLLPTFFGALSSHWQTCMASKNNGWKSALYKESAAKRR